MKEKLVKLLLEELSTAHVLRLIVQIRNEKSNEFQKNREHDVRAMRLYDKGTKLIDKLARDNDIMDF